jgi:SAM-dependent methyltransferase
MQDSTPKIWFKQSSLAKRIVNRSIFELKLLFGVDWFNGSEDRRVLERIIIPYFLDESDFCNILFVGCHWYTKGYNRWFEQKKKNYLTIEIDPSHRRYGAKQHIVDGLQNIAKHCKPGSLDLIICNGVFGWGLDDRRDIETAFEGCFDSLRDGGALVIGWDDVEQHRPFRLEECQSLRQFQPFVFPPLASANFVTDTSYRHTYSFFTKPKMTPTLHSA